MPPILANRLNNQTLNYLNSITLILLDFRSDSKQAKWIPGAKLRASYKRAFVAIPQSINNEWVLIYKAFKWLLNILTILWTKPILRGMNGCVMEKGSESFSDGAPVWKI
jgi:hypothetical protein